ncbi:MAG: hypothetical protein ACEQSK_14740 [Sphingomonadaceae bacterium]
MASDPRDAIWNETHQLLYHANYTEEIEKALLARWVWLDSATKITVAISSAGAALAGLVFWRSADYTFLWPVFTSASALLAIISKQLNVVDKVKQHAAAASELAALGVDIGTLLVRMKINAQFPVADFEKRLLALRERYRVEIKKSDYDVLLTARIRQRAQASVDRARMVPKLPENSHEQR